MGSFRDSGRRVSKQVNYADLQNGFSTDDEDFVDFTPSSKKKKQGSTVTIEVSRENKENEKTMPSGSRHNAPRRSPKQRLSVQERKFQRELEKAMQISINPVEEKEDIKTKEEMEDLKPGEEKEDLKPGKEKKDIKPGKEKEDIKPGKEKEDVKPEEGKEDIKPKEEKEDLSDFQGFKQLSVNKMSENLVGELLQMENVSVPTLNVSVSEPMPTLIVKVPKLTATNVINNPFSAEDEPVPSTSSGFTGKRQRKKVNFIDDGDSEDAEWMEVKRDFHSEPEEDSDFFLSPRKKKKKKMSKNSKKMSTFEKQNVSKKPQIAVQDKAKSSTNSAGLLESSIVDDQTHDEQERSDGKEESNGYSEDSDFSPCLKKRKKLSKNLEVLPKIAKQKNAAKEELKCIEAIRMSPPTNPSPISCPALSKAIIKTKTVKTVTIPKKPSPNPAIVNSVTNVTSKGPISNSVSSALKPESSVGGLKPCVGLVKTPFRNPTIGGSNNFLNPKSFTNVRIGLRLGLSRRGRVKPLHPNVSLK